MTVVVGERVVVEVDGAEELDAVEEDEEGCDVLGEAVGVVVVVVEPEDVDDSVDPVDGLVVVGAVDADVGDKVVSSLGACFGWFCLVVERG